jgi:hypothetical protein
MLIQQITGEIKTTISYHLTAVRMAGWERGRVGQREKEREREVLKRTEINQSFIHYRWNVTAKCCSS